MLLRYIFNNGALNVERYISFTSTVQHQQQNDGSCHGLHVHLGLTIVDDHNGNDVEQYT